MGQGTKERSILSPEGFFMLSIAVIFDLLGFVCFILVFVFGIGAVFGRIVSAVGFAVIGIWQFVRSGTFSAKKKKGEGAVEKIAKKMAKKFFKKHSWKLIAEALPVIGDIMPSFTLIVWSEFHSK